MPKIQGLVLIALVVVLAVACGSSEEPTFGPTRESPPSRSEPAATNAPAADRAPVATPAPVSRSQPAPTSVPVVRPTAATAESRRQPASTTAPAATAAPAAAATAAPRAQQESESGAAQPAPAAPAGTAGESTALDSSSQRAAPAQPTRGEQAGGVGQPPGTTFRDYGRQPFIETDEDSVSTFSLDTDRTSFQLALNWALTGYEVDPASVRAEEWINAFDYQYDPPEDGGSFSIATDVFRHPLDGGLHMARIGFQAPEILDATPLNVTLVLDSSGSMREGNRIEIARAAAESIRNSLQPRDRIAVVHFSRDVLHRMTVEHQSPDHPDVQWSIERLEPGGSTNVQAGLDLAVSLADQARQNRPDAYNYVILMSDGVANVDATNPFAILESAPDYDGRNPLRIITVGVGIENYNDVLLEQLAQYGNGWYRYLDNPEQARAIFSRDNWVALSTPFADQTRAQVTWDPRVVRAWRIVGYENRVTSDASFTEERKEFAELYSGAATTVFYELELWQEAHQAPSADLGTVELRWTDPVTGRPWRQHASVTGHPDTEFAYVNDPLLRFGAIVALSSDLYSGIPDFIEEDFSYLHNDLSSLLDRLQRLNRELDRLQAFNDFSFLLEHITADAADMAPPGSGDRGSGYSR